MRAKFSLDKYLKEFGLIGFGITLFWAGLSRILQDVRGSDDEDEELQESPEPEAKKEVKKSTGLGEF